MTKIASVKTLAGGASERFAKDPSENKLMGEGKVRYTSKKGSTMVEGLLY